MDAQCPGDGAPLHRSERPPSSHFVNVRRGGGNKQREEELEKFLGSVTVVYSPGNVQPPQQHQQLDSQIKHKPAVVLLANTVLNPGAVMVVTPDTVLTRLAVL